MRALHIITGLQDGGAEGALFRLVTHDTSYTHHVVSLTSGGKYQKLLKDSGIKVTSLDIKGVFSLIPAIFRLISVLKREQPSVVQTWMYHADLIGGLVARIFSNSKVVWGIRHSNHSDASKMIRYLALLSGKLSGWVPDKIVSCSDVAALHHQEIGYDAKKFVIIPNGYNFEKLHVMPSARDSLLEELELPAQSFLIGCVARWNEQKDHQNLLQAISMLSSRDVICLLIGSGCEAGNTELIAHLDRLGLRNRVKLLGQRSDIPRVMSALDLHVLPSSHGEAFPNVVAEAMACATPCVVTNVGDAAMIVDNYGWVVPPGNSSDLSETISEAIRCKSAGKLNALGVSAKESVIERFDIRVMCESFNKAWS